VKSPGSIVAARKPSARALEINWVQAYEKRMRRFNLEIIFFALVSLAILTTWLLLGLRAFFQ
jgi:hypothetical protein